MSIFKDKICIVTGGASGIGRSLCDQLARHGAYVVMADINLEPLEKAAEPLLKKGLKVRAVNLDVTDELAFKKIIEDTAAEHGQLDYLFNIAGIAIAGEVHDLTIDHWTRVFDVNLNGVAYGTFHAYQLMVKQGSGHIVNTCLPWKGSFPSLVPYLMLGPNTQWWGSPKAYGWKPRIWVSISRLSVRDIFGHRC